MKKEIDELIRLFKKLKEQADKEGVVKDETGFYQNINMLIGSYEMIKNQIPEEGFDEIHASIRDMIKQMITELKEELGEGIGEREELAKSMRDIDELLKKPGLTGKEIDELLDERIKQRKNKSIENE